MALNFKKLGFGCLTILVIIAAIIGYFYFKNNEALPKATPSKEADALAQEMLKALNKDAWDTLNYVKWTFKGEHHYAWDKKNNIGTIAWEDYKVTMQLDEQKGMATKDGEALEGDEKNKAMQKAWSYWCNDSFWFYAPYKVFDAGTTRSLVDVGEGKKGLMVQYESGGVTPGDAYLWILDQNNMPEAYKMWVKIIPVGGLKVTWQDWMTLPGGSQIATNHFFPSINIDISNIAAGQAVQDIGLTDTDFEIQ